MRDVIKLVALLMGLVASLSACQDCGPTDEPALTLTIQSQSPFRVDSVYGVGAMGKLPIAVPTAAGQNRLFQLPLNLNADSTRYILRIDGQAEAITVYYYRDFFYKSGQCGYVFDIKAPSTNPSKQVRVTRGQVLSITYSQNSFNGGFLKPATSTTGINLVVSL